MNLVIDQGNSLIKIGVFDQSRLIATHSLKIADEKFFNDVVSRHCIINAFVSSVKTEGEELYHLISRHVKRAYYFTSETRLPFINQYQTPGTLGKDRLAAVAGAIELYPNQDILVFDAGTAITYELVTKQGYYLGGNIAPGLQMRFQSLHHFTSKLPLCEPMNDCPLMGNSTQTAIVAGVQNSLIFEIDGYIESLKSQYPLIKIIGTGGDAVFLAEKLKNPIFVDQNLVLNGLNRILNHQLIPDS